MVTLADATRASTREEEALLRHVNAQRTELSDDRRERRLPMVCECGQEDCRASVLVSVGTYRGVRQMSGLYIVALGHEGKARLIDDRSPDF